LLRTGFARERPQPRACAARQQDRNYTAVCRHHGVVPQQIDFSGYFQNPLPDRNSLRIVRAMIVMSMRNDHFSM
jgi:hypothetical protein